MTTLPEQLAEDATAARIRETLMQALGEQEGAAVWSAYRSAESARIEQEVRLAVVRALTQLEDARHVYA